MLAIFFFFFFNIIEFYSKLFDIVLKMNFIQKSCYGEQKKTRKYFVCFTKEVFSLDNR